MNQASLNVSIIVPTYKGEKYVNSIINTLEPYYRKGYEIIIVDDGSPKEDMTLQRIKVSLPNAVLFQQSNLGVAAARNTGVSLATRPCLQFIDIDDTISADKIEVQYDALINSGADVVYSDWCMVEVNDEGKELLGEKVIADSQNDLLHSVLERWWVPFHSYLFRKSAYKDICGGNEKLVNAQDFDLILRLCISGKKFVYEPGLFSFYYRFSSATSLARSSRRKYWRDYNNVIISALDIMQNKRILKDTYTEAASQRLFHIARNIYDLDREWNKNIMEYIYKLNKNFTPTYESWKFKTIFRLFGYYKAEYFIRLVRKR